MSQHYVLHLNDSQADLETVGGKGASLARLATAGLPVPGGFHITTEAYRQFVAASGLQPRILAALEVVDVSQPATLEAASQSIHKLFMEAAIPTPIVDAISQAYSNLSGQPIAVAVRSSATAEDLPDASFAGQQETYLNISSTGAVLEAVKKCWASLWTARAIGYRARQNIDPDSVALAVVVQELVFADAAGILFTANPLNGSRDEAVVNAAWGLGEAIVGGMVTPDTLMVDKAGGRVLTRETANKQVMTVRVEGGTEEQPVPEARRSMAVLDDKKAAELVRQGVQIEKLYGVPMDIEWTLKDGTFAIVQARPITALPEAPVPELSWDVPDPKTNYFRGSVIELMPGPLTPLFGTLGLRIVDAGTVALFGSMFGPDVVPLNMLATINDYAYFGMKLTPRFIWRIVPLLFSVGDILRSGERRWQEARQHYLETVEHWQGCNLDGLPAQDILAAVRELTAGAVKIYNELQSGVVASAMTSEAVFTGVYDRLIKRKGDPTAQTFLLGFDSTPILAEKALYALAEWCRTRPGLAAHLSETAAPQIIKHLHGAQTPAGVEAGDWQDFQSRFDTYLRQHGHIIYDLDFASPTPADEPIALVQTLKLFANGQGTNPHERQQAAAERREQAVQTMQASLKWLRLKWFNKLVTWAQHHIPLREDSLADIGLGYPLLRQMLHELGRRCAAAGAIDQMEDVFWLVESEADQVAAALDQGEAVSSFADAIQERKARWEVESKVTPPASLPLSAKAMGALLEAAGPARTSGHTEDTIKGVGASPGQVTAPACVLHGPQDFDRMRPGDVLVAAITTPAWTPLFAMASAVVTDIGGPLSHGSIVAREYGIPAVLGTGVATRRIRSGQMVTVDGSAGQVVLCSDADDIQWAPPDPKGVYMRSSIVDLMPGPLSTLFTSLGISSLLRQFKPMTRRMIGAEGEFARDYFTSIHSYGYMNTSFPTKTWGWILFAMIPAYPRLLRSLVPLWRDELHPEYQAAVAGYKGKVPGQMSAAELWRDAQALVDAATYYISGLMFATMGASAGGEGLLTQAYNKIARQEGDPPATTLMMGWDNIPIRAEKSLYDLAMWVHERKDLAAYMLETPSEELVARLSNGQSPAQVGSDEWRELQSRFERHLENFGHIVFQLDFAAPLPLDHPEPMLENVKMYLRGEGTNPHERQKASEEKRIRITETMLGRLKGLKLWAFRLALNWGQALSAIREDALAEIGLAYPMMRKMLRELGRRFARAGAIDEASDIFWLEKEEVDTCVAALEDGRVLDSLASRVSQRKAFQQKMKQITPPSMIPYKERIMGIKTDSFIAHSEDAQTSDTLKGVATSAGKVTAPACVLHGSEDFDQMRPGDVLVAGTTTPAWTPLFAMASAVVTDIGGPLSHGSIVAREYGIPAVMGTGVATRRIQNGQMITVDGDAGTVEMVVEAP